MNVRTALHTVADEACPARLPHDLWARGRRRRRRRIAGAALALFAVALLLPLTVASAGRPEAPADGRPTVPSRVQTPLMFQATAVSSPPGAATVIVTAPGGFGAIDMFGGYEDSALVVGTSGSYRMVRHIDGFAAGESILLSPDGRYLAGDWAFESSWRTGVGAAATVVMDLKTGRLRTYRAGAPIAWFPDGTRLLTTTGTLQMLHLDTGAVDDLGLRHDPTNGASVAVSPDGRQAVVQNWPRLDVLDLDTHRVHTLTDLSDRGTLAGPGAWTPDGRIAIWRCTPTCHGAARADVTLTYLDAANGVEARGPSLPGVAGSRLLGFQTDGDAIVIRFATTDTPSRPDAPDVTSPSTGHPEVIALRPDGRTTVLVSLPATASRVDVATDLLERFGATPPSPPARFADWLRPQTGKLLFIVAVIAAIYGWRRRRFTCNRAGVPAPGNT
jgi:hypothetical protein